MFINKLTLAVVLAASFAAADFHLMTELGVYITCPSDEYNSDCWCWGSNRGELAGIGNPPSYTVHMQDVCGYGDIYMPWDQQSNSFTIYDAGNTYIGWCYYNYGYVQNCVLPGLGGQWAVYDAYTCITFLCDGVTGKRDVQNNTVTIKMPREAEAEVEERSGASGTPPTMNTTSNGLPQALAVSEE